MLTVQFAHDEKKDFVPWLHVSINVVYFLFSSLTHTG